LLAVEDFWSGGPGSLHSIVRFGMFFNWDLPTDATSGGASPAPTLGLLTPEMAFSIIPLSIQQAFSLSPGNAPPGWKCHPVPRWRGVPSQIGTATAWIRNALPPNDVVAFPFVALFPQSDPPGPRMDFVPLGQQFLTQYGWRVVLAHSAIRYTTDPVTQHRQRAPGCVCGRLDLP
jgi:hypothetical protein